ncbi:MAG: T9SS type A sorting domain-containing protein [Candidatus Eisenbacteria bacterium]|nr:T9SS type A sorting domain-containing protein [Candidatus Eisenbacteria bacterium]
MSATSPDSLPLTYAATPLPLGATFNPATRAFTWTPAYGQAGTYAVTFRATDTAAGADSEVVTLTVPTRAPGSNTPPALDPITDRTVRIETNLQIAVVAHDREGGTLTYSATSLPPGASFDTHRQVFSWLPHSGSEGIYRTVFHVADAQGQADSQSVLLKVTPGSAKLPPQGECAPESTQFAGTIGIDVQGLNNVATFHTFTVPPDAQMVQGTLTWTGGPVIDLDLYLVDSSGNVVTSGATATDDPEVATALNLVPGTYRWKVVSFYNPNPTEGYTVTGVVCRRGPTAVGGPRAGLEFALHPGEPNPFRARSLVRFSLPNAAPVQLRVFDVAGRRVRTLVDASLRAGEHQESWDGRSDAGAQMGSGVYFYRLSTPQGVQTRKTMLIR